MLRGSPAAGMASFTRCNSAIGIDGIERNDTTSKTASNRERFVVALIGAIALVVFIVDIRIQEYTTIPSVQNQLSSLQREQ
jgi:hypothetical protein